MSDRDRFRERPASERNVPLGMERAGARFGAHDRPQAPPPPPRPDARGESSDWLEWEPVSGPGQLVGALLIAVALIVVLLAVWRLRASNGLWAGVWALIGVAALSGAGYSAYLLRGLGTLRYVFTADALLVRWMRAEESLRYDELQEIVYRPRDVIALAARERFWPGYYISVMQRPEGVWRSYATEPPGRRMRLHGPTGVFAISPHRPVLFQAELERRRAGQPSGQRRQVPARVARRQRPLTHTCHSSQRAAGATDAPAARVERHAAPTPAARANPAVPPPKRALVDDIYRTLFREQLLGDQVASTAIALGVLLPLLMAGYLFSQYEGLLSNIPLHWDAHGYLDHIGAPRDLWVLPLTCVCILAVNTLLATFAIAFDRFAARLLTAATPIAQLAAFVALARLVS